MKSVAILTSILLVVAGSLRPPPSVTRDVESMSMWLRKSQWGAEFDVVAGGDSRVSCAVSPAAMQPALGRYRIGNFGFLGNAWEPNYLRALERLLDPKSAQKILLLGITPLSLTPRASRDNGFVRTQTMHPLEVELELRLSGLLHFLRPLNLTDIRNKITGGKRGYRVTLYPDGWMAQTRFPNDKTAELERYRRLFVDNQVDPERVDELIEAVEKWSDEGIRVFGFRPPSTVAMVGLEDSESGFDERELVARFEAAGGTWLPWDGREYISHDGPGRGCALRRFWTGSHRRPLDHRIDIGQRIGRRHQRIMSEIR